MENGNMFSQTKIILETVMDRVITFTNKNIYWRCVWHEILFHIWSVNCIQMHKKHPM